jgi:hypothetical protein
MLKELNLRWRVYVEIPKPARVELKCSQVLATPESQSERGLVSQHRPDAEGLISILKCLKLTIDIIFQSEVGDMLTVLQRAETFSVRKKMAAIKFEKSFVDPGRFWLSLDPLHSERHERVHFSKRLTGNPGHSVTVTDPLVS